MSQTPIGNTSGTAIALSRSLAARLVANFSGAVGDLWLVRQIWRFLVETEQLSDGTWRAWSPTGAWATTGATKEQALDKALEAATTREWAVVDMKADWRSIYP